MYIEGLACIELRVRLLSGECTALLAAQFDSTLTLYWEAGRLKNGKCLIQLHWTVGFSHVPLISDSSQQHQQQKLLVELKQFFVLKSLHKQAVTNVLGLFIMQQ